MKIYFCGMIGSGKTTIGRILARDFGVDFYDLDQEMDRILGHSFHRLVEEKGWVAFRELEYSICKRFAGMEQGVICLGGGTVRYEWNMDVLAGTGLFILLTAPLPVLAERVKQADRPRVNLGRTLEEDLSQIWEDSKDKYLGAADIVHETINKDVNEDVRALKELIQHR